MVGPFDDWHWNDQGDTLGRGRDDNHRVRLDHMEPIGGVVLTYRYHFVERRVRSGQP